jgi:hypothetical protein
MIGFDNAFSRSGRLSVSVATPSSMLSISSDMLLPPDDDLVPRGVVTSKPAWQDAKKKSASGLPERSFEKPTSKTG